MADGPRVVFMGMLGEFSRMVCEGTLHHGANLVAVVVPGEKRGLEPLLRRAGANTGIPILTPYLERNLLHLAWEMWEQQATLLMNHYGLSMGDPEARKFLREQMEEFFFAPDAAMPADFDPGTVKGGAGPVKGGAAKK